MFKNNLRVSKVAIIVLAVALIAAACNKSSNTVSTQTVSSDSSNPQTTSVTPTAPQSSPTSPTTPTSTPTTPSTPNSTPTPTPTPSSTPTSTLHIDNFAVTADDYTATPNEITVQKGDTVNLKLTVSTTNVYYGGLDFRSAVVTSGPIKPAASKTVTFTADSSFTIHCFWPNSGNEKQSQIQVNVE